jgi:hypothetical protein
MPRPGTLETCRKYLYTDADQIPDAYRDHVLRVRVGFTYWYEYPTKPRGEVKEHLVKTFGVTAKTAYEDIQIIEVLLGNIKNPEKAWIRYRVNSMLEQAYSIAEIKKDPKAMAIAADKMGRYNQLHLPDNETMPYGDIVPQNFEPTDDPSSLGIKKIPDLRERKRKLLEKYAQDIEAIDIKYDDLKDDDEDDK